MLRLTKRGINKCVRCYKNFEIDDIIATSSSKRYCYDCAKTIHLVTGKINHDLCNDKYIPQVLVNMKYISKKLSLDKNIQSLASLIIKTAFDSTKYVSKNIFGLASAAIFMAYQIEKESDIDLITHLPITRQVLQKNIWLLTKSLENTSVYSLSKTIHGVID